MFDFSTLVFVLEEDVIDIFHVLVENIILSLPSQVYTEEEVESDLLPSGQDWQVMTERDYKNSQAKFKQENSPFNQLKGLFEDTDDA